MNAPIGSDEGFSRSDFDLDWKLVPVLLAVVAFFCFVVLPHVD